MRLPEPSEDLLDVEYGLGRVERVVEHGLGLARERLRFIGRTGGKAGLGSQTYRDLSLVKDVGKARRCRGLGLAQIICLPADKGRARR